MEPALQAAAKSSMRRNASHDAEASADDAEYKYGTTNAERFTVKESVNELVSENFTVKPATKTTNKESPDT